MSLKHINALLWSAAIFFLAGLAQCTPVTVQIVRSDGLQAYEDANSGLRKVLRENLRDIQFQDHILGSEQSENEKILSQVQKRSSVILTIGTEATQLVSSRIKDRPVVFCMVLGPAKSGLVKSLESSGNNLSGASLDIPVKMQFEKFKTLVPDLRNLGVLCTAETESRVRSAEPIARSLGITLISVKVSSEKEIPQALEWLKGQTEGLWALPDAAIFTPSSTEQLLLFTLRNGVPFMGLSSAYVRAGALFSLDCDYADIGRQAGEIALSVLSGKSPSQIPIARPRKVLVSLNEKTAKRIGLKIPAPVLRSADSVVR
ncbi:MAG: ABC transporter substrate-binding protein [Candidatus Eisenbacteria bacterium]|nr:ABC transporter substrate-binding protein [Candidatus Eisenbacteria bacterium]